jgi:ketosteroid isomerase-like protein
MSDADSMRRLADRFVAAVESSDAQALDAIYARDAVIWRNYDRRAQPRDENIAGITEFPRLFKSFRYVDVRREFFPGGFVQQHVCKGVKANGDPFEVPVCMVIAVSGGRIARIDEYFDSTQDARPTEFR